MEETEMISVSTAHYDYAPDRQEFPVEYSPLTRMELYCFEGMDESLNYRRRVVSKLAWNHLTDNTGSDAGTMFRLLARYMYSKASILILCLFLPVVDQALGQASKSESSLPATAFHWGMDSLYHLDRGIRGAASCATSSCHGGPKAGVSSADAPRGSEYPIWIESDPHAQSWKTISTEASLKILTKLGILRDGMIADIAGYQNCLACHNTDRTLGKDQLSPRIAEGVGCESCHGPSETWYDRHYQSPVSTKTARRNLGLTESGPLVHRAKICATCHVGGRDRDMNHDIIAAGHPALYFDMAVYHEAYPKHWREPEENSKNFRAQLWIAGQIASADSELELLESRARKSLSVSTWPELSNYQCNSCHVTLDGVPKPVKAANLDLVVNGRAPVRNWNLAGLSSLSRVSNKPGSDFMVSVKELRVLLEAPSPDPKRVAAETNKLRVQLHASLCDEVKLSLRDWSRQKQLKLTIRRLEETERSNSWETAAGAYTAAWATHPSIAQNKLDVAMKTIRNGLLFPKDLMMPNFPRSENGRNPPTLEEWNVSLQQAVAALNDEVLR